MARFVGQKNRMSYFYLQWHTALGSERFQREIEVTLGRRARRGQAGRPSKGTYRRCKPRKITMKSTGNRGLPPIIRY